MHTVDLDRRDAAERLRRLAALLGDFAKLMAEQAEFHTGDLMGFGVSVTREAAVQAERRLGRIDVAGNRLLREMEKTLLSEIARATHTATAILAAAGGEAWPDLARVTSLAKAEIQEAAQRDRGLFTPSSIDLAAIEGADAAPFAGAHAWRALTNECHVALGHNGVPMAAVAWRRGPDSRWLAQVGGVGLALHTEAATAAAHAEQVFTSWFGPAPDLGQAPAP